MSAKTWTSKDQIARIRRVADTLCTGHANLRDRYASWSTALDLSIFALSTWLVALAFVDPVLNVNLTPPGWDPRLWLGVVSALNFFLTVVQLKVDWKGRSEAHRRSLEVYAEVKREAGYLLSGGEDMDSGECRRVLARYDMASAVSTAIPENEFLSQKRNHLTKVELSRYLDDHPTAWFWMVALRLWFRDNLGSGRTRAK